MKSNALEKSMQIISVSLWLDITNDQSFTHPTTAYKWNHTDDEI